jgi:hypothetical protein
VTDEQPKTTLIDGLPTAVDARVSQAEKAKGFVRPMRQSYRHVGASPTYPLRDLTPEEEEMNRRRGWGYVKYEEYPKGSPERDRALVGRMWTQAQLDSGCDAVTTLEPAKSETHAKDPGFYAAAFCENCRAHFDVGEFVWEGTDERVGS